MNIDAYISLGMLTLDRNRPKSLQRQLYESLREQILTGKLPASTQLPSTRALAGQLGVSRNTVVNAFDQLIAEGYLTTRAGAGTFVSKELPDRLLNVPNLALPKQATPPAPSGLLSKRGKRLMQMPYKFEPVRAFEPGIPEIKRFPFPIWEKLLRRHWQKTDPRSLGYNDPLGFLGLRQAIAGYLQSARGVRCSAEQIVITSGAQQCIDLATRLLLDPGDHVWLENPGYRGAWAAFVGNGANVVPVPVSADGLDLQAGIAANPNAKMAYVTPSHQYPIGVTMSAARRLDLLAWAREQQTWILEDDYDSEYRYAGHPLPCLQGLDEAQRVIYIGTFSKVLFPALRLAYMVVPDYLTSAFRAALHHTSRVTTWVMQRAMADFMNEGHFSRHIRRMRLLYAERQQVLLSEVKRLNLPLEINAEPAGLHVLAWLDEGVDDRVISAELHQQGVSASPLSNYSHRPLPRGGLVLGFGGYEPTEIRTALAKAMPVFR
ncbi:MAG: PLP-dependent aminotransferase family protein [Candidatus Promineifilaceae bacterium]